MPRACGKHGAADGMCAAFHEVSAGCHVIAKSVVRQIARTKACRKHCTARAPVIARLSLRLVNRAGAGEDAADESGRWGGLRMHAAHEAGKAAKHIASSGARGNLPLMQFSFSRHRQLRQSRAAGDLGGVDAFQNLGKCSGVFLRMRDLAGQRRHECRLSFGRKTRFQGVKKICHCITPAIVLVTMNLVASCAVSTPANCLFSLKIQRLRLHSLRLRPASAFCACSSCRL